MNTMTTTTVPNFFRLCSGDRPPTREAAELLEVTAHLLNARRWSEAERIARTVERLWGDDNAATEFVISACQIERQRRRVASQQTPVWLREIALETARDLVGEAAAIAAVARRPDRAEYFLGQLDELERLAEAEAESGKQSRRGRRTPNGRRGTPQRRAMRSRPTLRLIRGGRATIPPCR